MEERDSKNSLQFPKRTCRYLLSAYAITNSWTGGLWWSANLQPQKIIGRSSSVEQTHKIKIVGYIYIYPTYHMYMYVYIYILYVHRFWILSYPIMIVWWYLMIYVYQYDIVIIYIYIHITSLVFKKLSLTPSSMAKPHSHHKNESRQHPIGPSIDHGTGGRDLVAFFGEGIDL